MACTLKCRCGKNEMTFFRMNESEIETYDCDECPELKKEETPSQVFEMIEQKAEVKKPETAKQRKTREAKEAEEKANIL